MRHAVLAISMWLIPSLIMAQEHPHQAKTDKNRRLEVRILATLKKQGCLVHRDLPYALFVKKVDGPKLIDWVFFQNGQNNKNRYQIVAQANQAEIRVDHDKRMLYLFLENVVVISHDDNFIACLRNTIWDLPLPNEVTILKAGSHRLSAIVPRALLKKLHKYRREMTSRHDLVPSVDKRLEWAFGRGCPESRRLTKIDVASQGLALATNDFTILPNGRLRLEPGSVVLYENKPNKKPRIAKTIRSAWLVLQFDRPIGRLSDLSERRLQSIMLPSGERWNLPRKTKTDRPR